MNKKFLILIILLNFCNLKIFSQTSEIYKGEVINLTDAANLKQGKWLYFYDAEKTNISQLGNYENSKKEGIWLSFYSNGILKSSITYVANKQNGYVVLYYETGIISEEGLWKENRWVGEYKFYYTNGNSAYVWNFDSEGKRTGKQQYFYESGKLRIEGIWEAGKEQGIVNEYYDSGIIKVASEWKDGKVDGYRKEYYATGDLKVVKKFDNGLIDNNSIVYHDLKTNIETSKIDSVYYTYTNPKDTVALLFKGSGFHKLYNSKQLLEQEGEFQNGTLTNGSKFYYNSEGILNRTEKYKNGILTETIKQ